MRLLLLLIFENANYDGQIPQPAKYLSQTGFFTNITRGMHGIKKGFDKICSIEFKIIISDGLTLRVQPTLYANFEL